MFWNWGLSWALLGLELGLGMFNIQRFSRRSLGLVVKFSKSSILPKLILSHLECPRLTANMVLMSSGVVMADVMLESEILQFSRWLC